MTLRQKQSRFAWGVEWLLRAIHASGYEVTFGCATHVPCPKCGEYEHSDVSLHKKRLAIDINLFKDGKYLTSTKAHQEFGEYWESLDENFTWGGRFNDGNHYSYGEGK